MVSQIMIAFIGLLGFIIFIFGDDFNSLYIFSFLAFLGFFLYRPKEDEYQTLKNNYHG
jgi:preprotein translocase subunit Sss1